MVSDLRFLLATPCSGVNYKKKFFTKSNIKYKFSMYVVHYRRQ